MDSSVPEKKARNAHVKALRDSGLSLNQIVWRLEEEGYERISVQRVQAILKRLAEKETAP